MSNWTRAELKERAKAVLKRGNYWTAVLVMLICTILAGTGSVASNSALKSQQPADFEATYGMMEMTQEQAEGVVMMATGMLAVVVIVSVLVILYSVLVANVILVGANRYFLECRGTKGKLGTLFSGFTNGRYGKTVGGMFAMNLRIFLWSLLFVIPGIIKTFSYWMVPYILAENPEIGSKRALEISQNTMRGEKWNTFVLGLSFILWYLLGAIACGIGVFFVEPYPAATFAELYSKLRAKAEAAGYCQPGELGVEPAADGTLA